VASAVQEERRGRVVARGGDGKSRSGRCAAWVSCLRYASSPRRRRCGGQRVRGWTPRKRASAAHPECPPPRHRTLQRAARLAPALLTPKRLQPQRDSRGAPSRSAAARCVQPVPMRPRRTAERQLEATQRRQMCAAPQRQGGRHAQRGAGRRAGVRRRGAKGARHCVVRCAHRLPHPQHSPSRECRCSRVRRDGAARRAACCVSRCAAQVRLRRRPRAATQCTLKRLRCCSAPASAPQRVALRPPPGDEGALTLLRCGCDDSALSHALTANARRCCSRATLTPHRRRTLPRWTPRCNVRARGRSALLRVGCVALRR
jgi:hypothetical protein